MIEPVYKRVRSRKFRPPRELIDFVSHHCLGDGRWTPRGWLPHDTWLFGADSTSLVFKRFTLVQDPDEYLRVFQWASRSRIGPDYIGMVRAEQCWYGVFRWVVGAPAQDRLPEKDLLPLLDEMRGFEDRPSFYLTGHWLSEFERFYFSENCARQLLSRLLRDQPSGARSLAHGDFTTQNMILCSHGVVLIDWNQSGSAEWGFDRGWLLAMEHARTTSDGRCLSALSFGTEEAPETATLWFARLGLLRLLWRSHTMPLKSEVKTLVTLRSLLLIEREVSCAW